MPSTLTTFDFAIKERYAGQYPESLMFADRPLLGSLAKDEDFTGDPMPIPLIQGAPQGIAGASLATAQTASSNVVGRKFNLVVGDYFGTVDIGDKVMTLSRNNPGAFLENKAIETDSLYEQMADNIALYAFGNGGGRLGVIATQAAPPVMVLTAADNTIGFEVGMILSASANDGSDAAHVLLAGTATVTAVDRSAGTVTVNAIPAAWINGSSLFRSGDFRGNTTVNITEGLGSFVWVDNTPPVLLGMTRTSDPQRLAGCRVPTADIAGLNIEERIQILLSRMVGRFKGKGADAVYLHPEDWQRLSIGLQSRGERALKDDSTQWGYNYLQVLAGGKVAKVYADRFAPRSVQWALYMKSWKLYSALKLIHPQAGDGLQMLRRATTTDYEFRLISYPGLVTNAPGWNGRSAV